MLNGLTVQVGDTVRFTRFTNWSFTQDANYEVTEVGVMDEDGWFDIKVKGHKDWCCYMKFSKLDE